MNYIKDSPDNRLIRLGDICVIYISEHNRNILNIESEAQLQTKFGLLKAQELVGQPYGVRYECKRGWILPLRLTPEFWTELLPHRTQILYKADISIILLQLDIKPGSVIVESGTGSGSLSHNFIRACLPNGILHTFDINSDRVKQAQDEFSRHGLGNNVIVRQANVCEDGYGSDLDGKADACMLDLPQTWSAIDHAYKVLKPNGSRLCTFSPCIEQVQQNVKKMTELKMKDITTVECLLRPFDLKNQQLRLWDEDTLEGLAVIDKTRIENLKNNSNQAKRPKVEDIDQESQPMKVDENESDNLDPLQKALSDPKAPFNPNMLHKRSIIHAKQFNETVSHSGYLTFATKRP